MVRELSPQELRDFGFPELAFLKEQEAGSHPESKPKEKEAASNPAGEDQYLPPVNPPVGAQFIAPPSGAINRAPTGQQQILDQYKILISPLLSPLLRGKDGLIDLEKIPGGSFEEFKDFLQAQLSVDGRSFNDFGFLDGIVGKNLDEITDLFASYHRVIDREEFEPLLRMLYEEKVGKPVEEKSPGDILVASGTESPSPSGRGDRGEVLVAGARDLVALSPRGRGDRGEGLILDTARGPGRGEKGISRCPRIWLGFGHEIS